jgi:hypothetical protein
MDNAACENLSQAAVPIPARKRMEVRFRLFILPADTGSDQNG